MVLIVVLTSLLGEHCHIRNTELICVLRVFYKKSICLSLDE